MRYYDAVSLLILRLLGFGFLTFKVETLGYFVYQVIVILLALYICYVTAFYLLQLRYFNYKVNSL